MGILVKNEVINLMASTDPDDAFKRKKLLREITAASNMLTTADGELRLPSGKPVIKSPSANSNLHWAFSAWADPAMEITVDLEAAHEVWELAKSVTMSKGNLGYKCLRPYQWRPIHETLPAYDTWLGFEFETGYISQDARSSVIEWVWDNFDNVTFDAEGEGEWYSEISFTPSSLQDYVSGEAPACKFMSYLDANKELTNRTAQSGVGTHVNISIPAFREPEGEVLAADVADMLNRSLSTLDEEQFFKCFGRRQLYGGFYERRTENDGAYIEGKLFRTTYDKATWDTYLTVCRNIVRSIETYLTTPGHYIRNFFEVLCDPSVVPVFGTWETLETDAVTHYTTNGTALSGIGEEPDDDEDECDCWDCRYDRGEVEEDYTDDEEDYY